MVDEYKYLGQIISTRNKTEKELKVREANAWKAFWAQRKIFKSKMKLKTKIRIWESTVFPVLTYGTQTWATTKKQENKMIATQNSMMRSILQIRLKDRIKIQEIVNKNEVKIVWITIKKLKWKYTGHVIRETFQKWNKLLTTWKPHQGQRRRSRLIKRWVNEIQQNLGSQWVRVAKDRTKWKEVMEGYTQKWVAEGGVN